MPKKLKPNPDYVSAPYELVLWDGSGMVIKRENPLSKFFKDSPRFQLKGGKLVRVKK